jgi:ATP-dependent Lon protease
MIPSTSRLSREPFEQKALVHFAEVIINKSLIHEAGFGARTIPTYVGEWILSRYVENGEITQQSREQVARFIATYLPAKGQKDSIKNALLRQEQVKLLDDYSVSINLKTGNRQLRIPFLDMDDAYIEGALVEKHALLLASGVWGVGELLYLPPDGKYRKKGEVWMHNFKPFQVGALDLDYYVACRQYFTLEEWRDLLISSMGFTPSIYTDRQKMLLLTRMLPLSEARVNLVELAPKGTGKSFVYDNLSRYVRVIGGGKVTPAVLFHNVSTNVSGLVTRYDVVVFDEVQSIVGDASGELIAELKVYLESGKFSRGKTAATADAGLVMLGNISLNTYHTPLSFRTSIFQEIPNFLQETAFIDRIHGIVPGWELPRVSKETPSRCLGFKGDFFSEVLHRLRRDIRYGDFVKVNMRVEGCDDLRDRNAVVRLASAYVKLLFPDLHLSEHEFCTYCLLPAIELRQRVRDELYRLDPEYAVVKMALEG